MRKDYFIAAVLFLLISGIAVAMAQNVTLIPRDTAEYKTVMNKNLDDIEFYELTGDPDYDFARIMQIHNSGSIELVEIQMKKGTDPVMLNIAIKIRSDQQAENQILEKFLAGRKADKNAVNAFKMEIKAHIVKARRDVQRAVITGNADKDFAAMMAIHHRHGEDISGSVIKYGKDPALRKLAEDLLERQKADRVTLEQLETGY